MKNCLILTILFLFLLPNFTNGQSAASAASPSGTWVDFASVDYDAIPNLTYGVANNTELKLDAYVPRNVTGPQPTLVLFHGGGWVDGAKERNFFYLLPYLSMGWTVINVEYRLAKNSLAPAAVEDVRCSLRWLSYNAEKYKIDTSKFVLTGTSAGGHLALIAGMLPMGNPFDRQCPTDGSTKWNSATEPPIKVAAVVNWFGIADVADIVEGPRATHYAIEWFGSRPDRVELAKQLSPINNVRRDGPAVITLHGENDNVAPYKGAVDLHKALDLAGVKNKLITLKGRGHGGFSKDEMMSGYASIRAFLREVGVLSK